jgi:hypothetical protein
MRTLRDIIATNNGPSERFVSLKTTDVNYSKLQALGDLKVPEGGHQIMPSDFVLFRTLNENNK